MGIAYYAVARPVERSMEALCQAAWAEVEPLRFGSFAVRAKRSDKSFPHSSMDIASIVGRHLLEKLRAQGRDVRVQLSDPELTCYVEITPGPALVYARRIPGAGGLPAIPKGANVSGTVVTAKEKGKIKGEGQLALTLTTVVVGGQTYQIQTNTLDSTVKGKGKRTAATTGGGAAGGALIGGIAGGGKGAGIGVLVGAGAGFLGGAFTGNKQIEIPAETALTFSLAAPLTLPPSAQ